MTIQESANAIRNLRAALADLWLTDADRDEEVATLRRVGVAEADAVWLATQWQRSVGELADMVAAAYLITLRIEGVAEDARERIGKALDERKKNGRVQKHQ